MVERFDPPRDLDWEPLPMRPDIAGQYVRYSDLAAARAEIERLDRATRRSPAHDASLAVTHKEKEDDDRF